MQEVSSNLQSIIDNGINNNPDDVVWDFVQLYELYSVDSVPVFNPALAVARFSDIDITWNGNAYLRKVVDRSTIERSVSGEFNNVTVNFSNVDRYMANLFNTDVLTEGMHLVVRLVSRSITDSSIVLFTGRLDNPGDTQEETLPVQARQHGSVDYEVPKREFTEDDPEGRLPNDPLYEGFHFVAQSGAFDVVHTTVTPSTSFFGRLFGKTKRKTTIEHRQYSSQDLTPYGDPVPEAFGQVQMEGIPINFFDNGTGLNGEWVFCNGTVAKFSELKCRTDGLGQPTNVSEHHGFITGTIGGDNNLPDMLFPNSGTYSHTAYIGLGVEGSSVDQTDPAPTITAVILGKFVFQPDATGAFALNDWSDNPAYIAREILTNPDFIGLPPEFIDDDVCKLTGKVCDQPIIDTSNGERVFIPDTEAGNVGTNFNRFHSTGRLINWYYFHRLGEGHDIDTSFFLDQYDQFDVTSPPNLIAPIEVLLRRYTCNVTLTDRVKVVDFFFNTILPCFRGYVTIGANGKIQIRTEQPADSTLLTASTPSGATELPVQDIAPWVASLQGKVLINAGGSLLSTNRLTSEHRYVTSIKYSSAGNSITLATAVTGTITATRSSATLTGGTDLIAPVATVTIGGTITAGDEVVITIDGVQSSYLIAVDDTLETIAGVLADTINAHTIINRYVEAIWDIASPTIITIKSKLGSLVLDSPLVNSHTGGRANPTVAPTLSASAGDLLAGDYLVAYTDVTALGETSLSPATSITLLADEQIDVGTTTLPAGVLSRNWYLSTVPGSHVLAFVANNNGIGFSINALPLSTAQPAPAWNTTAEETVRVAMAFDASNIVEKSFKWPLRGNQTSYNQFTMKFRDAAHDFGEATYKLRSKVHINKVRKVNNLDIDGSAVDNWNQAVRLVRSRAAKELDGAPEIGKPTYFFQWTSRGRVLLLEEGDVVPLTDDTGGVGSIRFFNVPARIEKVSIANDLNVTCTARAYNTKMYSDYVQPRNIILPSSVSPRPSPTTETQVASVTFNLDTNTKQTLYTVPTGKVFMPSRVVFHNASVDLSAGDTLSLSMGFNSTADDYVSGDTGVITHLNDGTKVFTIASPAFVAGAAGDVFGIITDLAYGHPATVRVDVWGTLS